MKSLANLLRLTLYKRSNSPPEIGGIFDKRQRFPTSLVFKRRSLRDYRRDTPPDFLIQERKIEIVIRHCFAAEV
jgi:hypothetical protein